MSKDKREREKNIAVNRKAKRDYEVIETYEAGIVLVGTEVKSLREGRLSFKDSYAAFKNGELWLFNVYIPEYSCGNRFNHDPERPRKLLLHKRELKRLLGAVQQKGFTLIPLRFYFKGPYAKVEIALCRGKKKYDKRKDIAEREAQRNIERALKKYR